ncbi:MAG: HYR domain-containing protein, partial [Saprospiraceae bacterium]|nr:HYR domain-containing protein [Saprospiraceae bacterium]
MKRFKTLLAGLVVTLFSLQTQGQLTITANSGSISCDTPSYCMDVVADGFNDISIFQFSLSYDSTYWNFDSVINSFHGNLAFAEASTGEVNFSWFEFPVMTSLPPGSVLFSLCLAPTGLTGTTPVDFIDGANTPIQIADGSGMLLNPGLDYFLVDASVDISDSVNPVILCPADTTIMAPSGSAVMDIGPAVATDNCFLSSLDYNISGATATSGSGDASGEMFNEGTSTITYTGVDASSNNSSCVFDVELINTTDDSTFQFIPNVTIDCDLGIVELCVAANNFEDIIGLQTPILWDTAALTYQFSSVHLPPTSSIAEGGVANGIMAFIFSAGPSLPSGLTIPDGDTMFCSTFDINIEPVSTTSPLFNFMDIPGLPISVNEGEPFIILPENYEFIDSSPPVLTNCPTDTTIVVSDGSCETAFTWVDPTITDDCDANPILTSSHVNGSIFTEGSTLVTFTATDQAGNTSTCDFVVTVTEDVDPEIDCPNDTVIISLVPMVVNGISASATDSCSIPSLSYTLGG